MKTNSFGKIYIAMMSLYFIISGIDALLNIDEKLARIGLSAITTDGEIAFILIYCSLMVGIGIAIALLFYFSKTWQYSALLAVIIISSFICFRLVGFYLTGVFSNTQISFLSAEVVEVVIGIVLLYIPAPLEDAGCSKSRKGQVQGIDFDNSYSIVKINNAGNDPLSPCQEGAKLEKQFSVAILVKGITISFVPRLELIS